MTKYFLYVLLMLLSIAMVTLRCGRSSNGVQENQRIDEILPSDWDLNSDWRGGYWTPKDF